MAAGVKFHWHIVNSWMMYLADERLGELELESCRYVPVVRISTMHVYYFLMHDSAMKQRSAFQVVHL
ncbi:unnamed protein product [Urochloa humidicola]